MTNKEQIIRNIGLSFDFLRQIVRNPVLLDSIKNGSNIDFIEKDFKKLKSPLKDRRTKFFRVKSIFEDIRTK